VALSGNTAVAGSVGPIGPVGIFERNLGGPDAWGRATTRFGSGGLDDTSSTDVAISGDIAVISDVDRPLPGGSAARIFSRNQDGANAWGPIGLLEASDAPRPFLSRFGRFVAIDGKTVVLSDTEDNENGDRSGSVYVCELGAAGKITGPCRLREGDVNRHVSLRVTSQSCCGPAPADLLFTLTAVLTNTSTSAIYRPFFQVAELSRGNVLANADPGPSENGVRLTPDVGDGVLSPGESVIVTFEIVLTSRQPFRFVVGVRGDSEP
jgi:hypothetical protein